MKIYFCDLCNESIPLKDINSNRITIEEGKILCQQCAPKRGRMLERPPLVVSIGFGVLMVALLGLGALVVSLQDRLDGLARTQVQAAADAERRFGSQQDLAAESAARTADAARARAEEARLFEAIERLQRSLATLEGRSSEGLAAVERRLEERAAALTGRIDAGDALLREAAKERSELGRGLEERIVRLEAQIAVLVEMSSERRTESAAPKEPAPAPESAPSAESTETERLVTQLLRQLESADPGQRYPAVIGLGRHRHPEAEAGLIRALKDPESYIRVAALQKLRGLSAVASIPAIIPVLRDADYFVRLTASNALTSLSGHTIDFAADGPAADRDRAITAWERFWETEGERLTKAR